MMEKKIKVLHIFAETNRGGAETLIMTAFRGIDRSRFQFDFLISKLERCSYDDEIEQLGGHIFRIPQTGFRSFSKALKVFFTTHSYDIVHIHRFGSSFFFSHFVKKYSKAKVITHIHSIQHFPIYRRGWIIMYNLKLFGWINTDLFLCCSNKAKSMLRPISKIMRTVKVLKNGIDEDKFKYSESSRNKIRKELNLSSEALVVGHTGRFSKEKNHSYIIDVFNHINAIRPNSKLLLVGDGPLKPEIIDKVNKLGLSEKVIFSGVRKDVPELLSAMDCFVFPSFYEGLGIALIEAQNSGLPCITSAGKVPNDAKVSSLLEFVDLEKGPEIWAETILKMSNENVRNSHKEDIVKNGYSIGSLVSNLQSSYEDLLSSK